MLNTMIIWLVVLAAIAAAGFLAWNYFNSGSVKGAVFRQRTEPRLGVVEHVSVDSRRRLILIRRDGIEHLIMTGGPVDIVIETGIGQQAVAPQRPQVMEGEALQAVYTRQPRSLSPAVNE